MYAKLYSEKNSKFITKHKFRTYHIQMLLFCCWWINILITEDMDFKEINIEFGRFVVLNISRKNILVGKCIVGVSYFGHTN